MDSGNSGSLQSSSGGEDEFDSRCGGGVDSESSSSLAALLRQSASPSFLGFGGSFYGLQELAATPLPPLPQSVHPWSAALPAGSGAAASSSSSSSHAMPAAADQAAPSHPELPAPPRGSRKRTRTRASRRAPTTVLTTDTTNFRAMVQEFTGIPSPPFAAAPARSRFDHLFPSPSSLRSGAAAASFPPYLLRPFAHKIQTPHFSPSASSQSPSNIATASTSAADVSYQYYLLGSSPAPSSLGMRDHSGNYISFQSPLAAQLGGDDAKYASHPFFDAAGHGLPPPPRLQDSSDFLHPRNRDHELRDDELTGMFAAASAGGGDRSRTTNYSPDAAVESTSSAGHAATTTTTTTTATAATRTQGVDSWICTSE